MAKSAKFYSKILLFGEYSVIKDSMALCIPYQTFFGQLSFPNHKGNLTQDNELAAFGQYLKRLSLHDSSLDLDVSAFEFDISGGLEFQSNIPQGYGVGSSGALCAAVYAKYSGGHKILNHSEKLESLNQLKAIFSKMESHFHGSSSGLDPLISYFNRPILKNRDQAYEFVDLECDLAKKTQGGLFLLNTGRSRRTEPLVNLFLEKYQQEEFKKLCHEKLIVLNDCCINDFLNKNYKNLYEHFYQLSHFQYHHLAPMIPKLYRDLWKKGLDSENFSLKLCGAGGGGFILGLCRDYKLLQKDLEGNDIKMILNFL